LQCAASRVDFDKYPRLRTCENLANKTKHLARRTTGLVGEISLDIREPTNTRAGIRYRYELAINAKPSGEEVQSVAREALDQWKELITSNGGVLT
jgi:hypothetical protein